jgi:hypothetical protein
MINLATCKLFGLVDIRQRGLEGNRTVVIKVENSSVVIPTIDKTPFRGHSIGASALCWMIYASGFNLVYAYPRGYAKTS